MKRDRLTLALIVLIYLSVATLYAVKTPDWQVPDEPAHYNYIRQLATEGQWPVLQPGDYDQSYLARLTGERFPPELSLQAVEYEDHQPPLYYLLATPVYLLFDGALVPLRMFSVVLGAGIVLLAYAVVAEVFPQQPRIALGTAAFVAFLPQHVAMMAGVNNDSLAELWIGLTLWLAIRQFQSCAVPGGRERRDGWLSSVIARSVFLRRSNLQAAVVRLGVVLGLGLVTKTTCLPIAAALAVTLLTVWWRDGDGNWKGLLRTLALTFGPALIIAAPWWMRNLSLYGGLDLYGLANHDAVVLGQPRTLQWIQEKGLGAWLERGLTFTFQSFWGQFGWMGVLMPTWLYRALALWSGVLAGGVLAWRCQRRENKGRDAALTLMVMTLVFTLLAYGYYNRTFVQHQGRYLFPALIPLALGTALSSEALLNVLYNRVRCPERLRPLAFAIPYLAMVALDLYALWRLILPALT